MVLPLASAAGLSWERFRELIVTRYTDLQVETIAAAGTDELSFSADTGMAECLVIAKKQSRSDSVHEGRFTSLNEYPQDIIQGWLLGNIIASETRTRSVDDGPYGGTPVKISGASESSYGETVSQLLPSKGGAWGAVRVKDFSLAQTAHALPQSKLWLPGMKGATRLPSARLGAIASAGTYHLDITGPAPRGPFHRRPASSTATYPSLWNHDAKRETRMICTPDSQLIARQEMEQKASSVWETASRAHINLDFRFNSQPLGAAFTAAPSIGGRAWPNVLFDKPRFDYVFSLWMNSTLGLLSFWWNANRQHSGRGTTTINAIESMPVLDFRELDNDQLAKAERIFEEFRDKEFLPAYLADADPNRDLLDRRVVMDMLGFDEDTYLAVRRLAQKWCAEPSVHGGKARPRDARPIPGNSPPIASSTRMDIG